MKKTYLTKRNAIISSAGLSWGACALLFAIFFLLIRLVAPNFFLQIFTPVFRASDALATKSHAFVNAFRDTAELALQNEKLMNENAARASENHALIKKIESLSGLGLGVKGIIAGVVARPPMSPYDVLVLSAGSEEGISIGMEAFGEGGVPLGIISSVSNNFSRITLFSAPEMTVNGWIGRANSPADQAGFPLTIKGAGAGAINASISRAAGISAGDVVFAPGPGMLPIGRVVRVDSDPASSSVVLRIMPTLNLFSIAWVVVRDTGISLP
ncbi:MAG: rod shape-determining protein MreC [bacterium]|nr:rod shape-determining protein MreC [bacterium]